VKISWRRAIKWLALGFVGLVLAAYLLIGAGLKWYSSQLAADLAGAAGSRKLPSVVYESRQPHTITLLNHGLSSLYARLALIRSAKKSIELEFFIYDLDFSAKWITSELIARANQGIKIRLLVDFAGPVFQLQPEYAQLLERHGIEVRYYNTSPGYRIVSIHHRNHRKLLVVDDEVAILGGRNIADAYFGVSREYNFLDSDVQVRGDIVKGIRETFDMYWTSQYANTPDLKAPRDFLALEPGEAEDHRRAGVAHHVGHLPIGVARVQPDVHQARPQRGDPCDEKLRARGAQPPHPLAPGQSGADEGARHRVDPALELGVRGVAPLEPAGLCIGGARRVPGDVVAQARQVGQARGVHRRTTPWWLCPAGRPIIQLQLSF